MGNLSTRSARCSPCGRSCLGTSRWVKGIVLPSSYIYHVYATALISQLSASEIRSYQANHLLITESTSWPRLCSNDDSGNAVTSPRDNNIRFDLNTCVSILGSDFTVGCPHASLNLGRARQSSSSSADLCADLARHTGPCEP